MAPALDVHPQGDRRSMDRVHLQRRLPTDSVTRSLTPAMPTNAVRIISTPPGEAPEEIRRAWVGLVVPLSARHGTGPRSYRAFGVLTAPRGMWRRLWGRLTGKTEEVD